MQHIDCISLSATRADVMVLGVTGKCYHCLVNGIREREGRGPEILCCQGFMADELNGSLANPSHPHHPDPRTPTPFSQTIELHRKPIKVHKAHCHGNYIQLMHNSNRIRPFLSVCLCASGEK